MTKHINVQIIIQEVFIIIQYRRILELAAEQMSVRAIAAATRHGRPKVYEVMELAKKKGLVVPLSEEQDDRWIEGFLYPHKTTEGSGYGEIDFEWILRTNWTISA